MEALRSRPSGCRKKNKRHPSDETYYLAVDDEKKLMAAAPAAQENSRFSSQKIIYYSLLFLKVALWVTLAWILSHLHLGAPCFLLLLTFWLYSVPMERALNWIKRRLGGRAARTGRIDISAEC